MPETGTGRKIMRIVAVLLVAATLLLGLCAPLAEGQCALCRSAVSESGEGAAQAMNLGILVLLVPPVALFCSIFAAAFRRDKGEGDD